tara:strand:+ start:888 stop:1313 length:426 start_codon:yes stop_codon:yes gene_type:complete
MGKSYWLLKTEPDEWSWESQIKAGNKGAEWSGVRNFQAAKNLRSMKVGDKCFFYHTGKEKKIIGVVQVNREFYLDKTDKNQKFVSITVRALYPLKREVGLQEIKKDRFFKDFSLVKQSRLSVMEVSLKYWKKICKIGKVYY